MYLSVCIYTVCEVYAVEPVYIYVYIFVRFRKVKY